MGIKYLFPFLAFGLGVFVTEQINARYKMAKKIHWRQLVLLIEIIILTIVGFIPETFNMVATIMVSVFRVLCRFRHSEKSTDLHMQAQCA